MYGIHWRVFFPWYEWENGVGFNFDIDDDTCLERLLDEYAFY